MRYEIYKNRSELILTRKKNQEGGRMMRYCEYCKRQITAKKKLGLTTLLFGIFMGGKKKRCPICGSKTISLSKAKKKQLV